MFKYTIDNDSSKFILSFFIECSNSSFIRVKIFEKNDNGCVISSNFGR